LGDTARWCCETRSSSRSRSSRYSRASPLRGLDLAEVTLGQSNPSPRVRTSKPPLRWLGLFLSGRTLARDTGSWEPLKRFRLTGASEAKSGRAWAPACCSCLRPPLGGPSETWCCCFPPGASSRFRAPAPRVGCDRSGRSAFAGGRFCWPGGGLYPYLRPTLMDGRTIPLLTHALRSEASTTRRGSRTSPSCNA